MSKLTPFARHTQLSAFKPDVSPNKRARAEKPLADIFKVVGSCEMRREVFSFFTTREVVRLSLVSGLFSDFKASDLIQNFKEQLKTKKISLRNLEDFRTALHLPTLQEVIAIFPESFKHIVSIDASLACVSEPEISEAQLATLMAACPNVHTFSFANRRNLTDDFLFLVLQRYPKLKELQLEGCSSLTNKSATALAKCSELTVLNLSSCNWLDNRTLVAIAQSNTKLKELSLSGCYRVDNQAVMAFAYYCPELLSIDLGGCTMVGRHAMVQLANGCPLLRLIDLSYCINLTESSFIYLVDKCRGLTHIDLYQCEWVTDDVIREIGDNCVELVFLGLKGCKLLTDEGILRLTRCQKLKTVNLSSCQKVTDNALLPVFGSCKELSHIKLNNLHLITDLSVIYLALHSKTLEKIELAYCRKMTAISVLALACSPRIRDVIGHRPQFHNFRQEISYQAATPPGRRYADNLKKIVSQVRLKYQVHDPNWIGFCLYSLKMKTDKVMRTQAVYAKRLAALSTNDKVQVSKIIQRLDGDAHAQNNTPLLADAFYEWQHTHLFIATSTS